MSSSIVENISGYDLSNNQKIIWNFGSSINNKLYNQVILKFEEKIPRSILESCLKSVIDQHQILSFSTVNHDHYTYPFQKLEDPTVIYDTVNLNTMKGDSSIEEDLSNKLDAKSNNSNSPIHFCMAEEKDSVHFLGIRLKAFWGDAYSIHFFCSELNRALQDLSLYNETELEKVPYVNFCAWQNELLEEPEEDATHFWSSYVYQLDENIIPFKHKRNRDFCPQKVQLLRISDKDFKILKQHFLSNNTTLNIGALRTFLQYIGLFSEDEITIGYHEVKRDYEELENTMGLVSKYLPLVYAMNPSL